MLLNEKWVVKKSLIIVISFLTKEKKRSITINFYKIFLTLFCV